MKLSVTVDGRTAEPSDYTQAMASVCAVFEKTSNVYRETKNDEHNLHIKIRHYTYRFVQDRNRVIQSKPAQTPKQSGNPVFDVLLIILTVLVVLFLSHLAKTEGQSDPVIYRDVLPYRVPVVSKEEGILV